MKTVLIALANQLQNYSGLSYAHKYAYIARDPGDLVSQNNFPFYNIYPGNKRILVPDKLSRFEFERHIYPVTIHFSTMSLNIDIAIMGNDKSVGILDFSNDLWEAIKEDKTLGGLVDGVIPGFEVPFDTLKSDSNQFLAISEFTIEFYKDVPIV